MKPSIQGHLYQRSTPFTALSGDISAQQYLDYLDSGEMPLSVTIPANQEIEILGLWEQNGVVLEAMSNKRLLDGLYPVYLAEVVKTGDAFLVDADELTEWQLTGHND